MYELNHNEMLRRYIYQLEREEITSFWSWTFADNEQMWSPGLYRLLGLEKNDAKPSYDMLRQFIHPEDRLIVETPVEISEGQFQRSRTFRIIQSEGSLRTVSSKIEIYLRPDGKPRAASGILVDVTEHDRLKHVFGIEKNKIKALYEKLKVEIFSVGLDHVLQRAPGVEDFYGVPMADLSTNPFITMVKEQRNEYIEINKYHHDNGMVFQRTVTEILHDGQRAQFRIIVAPIYNSEGHDLGRAGIKFPASMNNGIHSPHVLRVLERKIEGKHLRAARSLLDWSMADLCAASGLSLSTIRRLEEDTISNVGRSRDNVIDTFRRSGIRFISLDDGNIAIAKY